MDTVIQKLEKIKFVVLWEIKEESKEKGLEVLIIKENSLWIKSSRANYCNKKDYANLTITPI